MQIGLDMLARFAGGLLVLGALIAGLWIGSVGVALALICLRRPDDLTPIPPSSRRLGKFASLFTIAFVGVVAPIGFGPFAKAIDNNIGLLPDSIDVLAFGLPNAIVWAGAWNIWTDYHNRRREPDDSDLTKLVDSEFPRR